MIFYLGTDSNKIITVKVDDETGSLVKIVQCIHPVGPNPLGIPEGIFNGVSTEWISRHPKYPLVYALTSYWNAAEACVTTFQINCDESNDSEYGSLTQIGESSSTGGFQAAHATFSPDCSLYVIAHHNDGKLTFFDCSKDRDALQNPILILETPEIVPGTRRVAKQKDSAPGQPSLHHVQYSPNQQYLLTTDPGQDQIFTYPVNERGLPTTQQPTTIFKCYSDVPIYGYFQYLITKYILKCKRRARKTALHPNGKYIYLLHESINLIQVYAIDNKGVIDGEQCIQELSTLDASMTSSSWYYPVGICLQLAAELHVSNDGTMLLVSNRGEKIVPGSKVENSIRAFAIQFDGRLLKPLGTLSGVSGPVRHFISLEKDNNYSQKKKNVKRLVAAVYGTNQCIQTYQQLPEFSSSNHHQYRLVGEAEVGANVFCIAH